MNEQRQGDVKMKASWVAGALGIVLAYFGMFAVLMYPVFDAAGFVS